MESKKIKNTYPLRLLPVSIMNRSRTRLGLPTHNIMTVSPPNVGGQIMREKIMLDHALSV